MNIFSTIDIDLLSQYDNLVTLNLESKCSKYHTLSRSYTDPHCLLKLNEEVVTVDPVLMT